MKIKETEIGHRAVQHFKEHGWDVYQEVTTKHGNVIDLVIKMGIITHCIELKTTLNLDVISQATNNKHFGNYSSIIVPSARTERNFAEQICKDYGIGLYYDSPYNNGLRQVVPPKLIRKYLSKLELLENQKDYAEAGNSDGRRYTPFLQTKNNLIDIVKYNQGIPLSDAIKQMKHHYNTDVTARGCLKQWIGTKALPELKLIDKKVYLKDYEVVTVGTIRN